MRTPRGVSTKGWGHQPVAATSPRCDTGGMSAADLALFRRFPELVGRVAHRPFLKGTTPVERFALPGVPDDPVCIKRDDASSAPSGGNKPRKLVFLIGEGLARGARRLVTTGGLGTNHGMATTLLGAEAGLATSLVLVDQPVTEAVRTKLRLFRSFGAELHYAGSVAGAAAQVVVAMARAKARGERPFFVPPGGSSPLGTLGFVSAALELAEQVEAGALPEPARVYAAVGSGGTAAGLVLGFRLAGLATRVVPVLVIDIVPPTPPRIVRLARRVLALLRRHGADLPDLHIAESDFDYVWDQLGPGYGTPTPAADEAIAAAREAGIALDATYTGKALAALLADVRHGRLHGPALFWNSYNSVPYEELAPRLVAPGELPRAFQRFFDAETDAEPAR